MKIRYASFAALALLSSFAGAAVVSTGDLGLNIINGGAPQNGYFAVNLATPLRDNLAPANMRVIHGLWNGGTLFVEAKVNGTSLGMFNIGSGYISPGPTTTNFNVTGLLNDGNNLIEFQGQDLAQDYVIGQVDIEYAAVPEPATIALLGLGLAAVARRRRR